MFIVVGIVPFAFGLVLLCAVRLARWWLRELRLDIESMIDERWSPPPDSEEDRALQARLLQEHRRYYGVCRLLSLHTIMPTVDEMVGHPSLDGRPTLAKVATRIAACAVASYGAAAAVVSIAALFGRDIAHVVPATGALLFLASSLAGPLRWMGATVLPGFGLAYSWIAYARSGGEIPVQPNARSVIAAYFAAPAVVAAWPSASQHHDPSFAACVVAFAALVAWAAGFAASRLAPDLLFARRGEYARTVRLVIPALGESCTGPDGFNLDVLNRRLRRMNPDHPQKKKRGTKSDPPRPQRPTAAAVATIDDEPRVVEFCGRLFIDVDTLRPPLR
ncbi:MAG TPA: hypothetical protein VN224_05550 [Xanthomonadales bacterium]|nr:hypothetical protein [Xanthomonadales bacterium]